MYKRKAPDRWNNRIYVLSLFLFLIFATVSIIGIFMIVSEIGKITEGQQRIVTNLTGDRPDTVPKASNQNSAEAYVNLKDFVQHQRSVDNDIKSIKYELEKLRAKISKRSNPL